jgi:2-methylisocitrate lyase-like PEP mutase family enzyme
MASRTVSALHHGPGVLVLPNAWDCASASARESP